ERGVWGQAASTGRLPLGLGPSHPVVVENMHGLSYAKPYSHTVEYLEVLERAFAGPGQVHFEGEEFRVNALLDVPGATPIPVLIAALAPKMLRLAGSRTQGTITWMADERSIEEYVVPRLVAPATETGCGARGGRRGAGHVGGGGGRRVEGGVLRAGARGRGGGAGCRHATGRGRP